MNPVLNIDLVKLEHNAEALVQAAAQRGIEVYGVTKVLCGDPQVGAAMLRGGVTALAESRLENLDKLTVALPRSPRVMLRLPQISHAAEVAALADISLNSELLTLEALGLAASHANKRHGVIIMVDLGDLREGVWPEDVPSFVKRALQIPGLQLLGLGTNLTCYGGVIPEPENLSTLVEVAKQLEGLGLLECQVLSGGNSSSLDLLFADEIPEGINNLRIGEAIILGCETVNRRPVPGLHLDAITIEAEVIELKEKPSVPVGRLGQDAFGNTPSFVDRGRQRRAILALGRQDVDPDGLEPVAMGLNLIGASSDHLILDATDYEGEFEVGSRVRFIPNYSALLRAATSPYLTKRYI